MPKDSKEKEAKKLEGIISEMNIRPEKVEAIIERIEKPSLRNLPTNLYKFSKRSTTILIIGDLHLNALDGIAKKKLCDSERLKKVLQIAEAEGAEYAIQTGDVTDGENMRPWQKYNLVVQGFDSVVEYCANEWPTSKLKTYFIGGNHDQTYFNSIGADICQAIADKRKDLKYLGMNEANIPLQPAYIDMILKGEEPPADAAWIRIRHPAKGTAKGQSYQPQSHIEAARSEFKPQVLIIGHYHKLDYLFERNIHCFQAGTFEKQSDWMRTKDIAAHLGAWLVTFYYKEDGSIDGVRKRALLTEVNGNEKWGKHMNVYFEKGIPILKHNETGVYESG